jgi:electron transport complex protein RnfG
MYRAIVGVGVLCALLIVGVYQATAERIRANESEALQRAVSAVLPAAISLTPVSIDSKGGLRPAPYASAPLPAFLGYDAGGVLIGAAVTADGMGYQDTIRVSYAYSFSRGAIVGLQVLESKETPGLGDKIETDADFKRNFEHLDVALNADGSGLRNPIQTVAAGSKQSAWQIDAITGATISSEAIGEILNRSAQRWVPALQRDGRGLLVDRGLEGS